MDRNYILELAKWFDNSSLSSFIWVEGDSTLKLKKKINIVSPVVPTKEIPMKQPIMKESIINEVEIETNKMLSEEKSKEELLEDVFIVRSPVVGSFYASVSPDEAPFIKIGQRVSKGDTLCIVEAMKLFNEVEAPVEGIIKNIFPSNGDMLEFDQKIVEIEVK